MRRLLFLLPVLAFAVLALFLFRSLFMGPPDILPSVLIDKPAPPIALGALNDQTKGFDRADLATGRVTVINFFASWCAPCRLEAGALMTLSKASGFALYGVAYKDKPADTEAFLGETGNPFSAIVSDDHGQVGIDWGVTAAPETFIVDGRGVIRYKHVGEITDRLIAEELLPAIQKARQNS